MHCCMANAPCEGVIAVVVIVNVVVIVRFAVAVAVTVAAAVVLIGRRLQIQLMSLLYG